MWGWTVTEQSCFALLDEFYQLGGRRIDGATNYPINKVPEDFRKAEKILATWCRERQVEDLEVIMKVGSLNNMMTPDQNLAPSFLMICADEYRHLLGGNLHCLMIHWDNRSSRSEIESSLSTLNGLRQEGLSIGLSGIRHPEVYAELLAEMNWQKVPVEMKHNLVYSDYERYAPLHAYASFIAYGINAGGLKLDPAAYSEQASLLARGGKPDLHRALIEQLQAAIRNFVTDHPESTPPTQMNHLGMLYAAYHPGVEGVLLGPSSVAQLQASYAWLAQLFADDYHSLHQDLCQLSNEGRK